MFFRLLGSLISRYWHYIILLWVLAILGVAIYIPDLGKVARDDISKIFPPECDSMQAKAMLDKYFPKESYQSRFLVVMEKPIPLTEEELEWLSLWMESFAQHLKYKNINEIITPIHSKLMREKLVSKNGRAAMAVMTLSSHYTSKESQAVAKKLLFELKNAPPDITLEATGDAIIEFDYHLAIRRSLHTTTWATLLLLSAILIFIFRSPITPFIPLATIGVSFYISKGVAALFALSGAAVSTFTEILLVVILFGAGTDYCVFLIFRYCEELTHGSTPHQAMQTTLSTVGKVISSSALTVIIAAGCLLFSQFGPFRQTGPFIAIGVAIALLAALTLTPALMIALRGILFWPSRTPRYNLHPVIAVPVARLVVRRPFWVTLILVVVLATGGHFCSLGATSLPSWKFNPFIFHFNCCELN